MFVLLLNVWRKFDHCIVKHIVIFLHRYCIVNQFARGQARTRIVCLLYVCLPSAIDRHTDIHSFRINQCYNLHHRGIHIQSLSVCSFK